MKIEGNGRVAGPGGVRRTQKGPVSGERFALDLGETGGAAATAGPQGPAPVNALFALQEVPDPMARHARAVRAGHDVLDQLEELKLCILAGRLPRERLDSLLLTVRARRETVVDPRLRETLDEIELRAEVELAKLGF
jgi:hypothetical protein